MRQQRHKENYRASEILTCLRNFLSVTCCILFTVSSPQLVAKDNDVVRIAMSTTPLSSPFIIAYEKGYFKELGLNVEIKQVKGGNLSLKAVFAGEADIATSSEAVVMFNSFKRNDFSIFCTFVTSDNDVKILARADSGINSIADLKGKKVGTILGTSAHFFLSHTLLMNGISEKKVNVLKLEPQQTKSLLENKTLDAVVTWEPFAYLAKRELGNKVKLVEHDRVYVETFNAITMREYARKNIDTLSKIIQALIKAVNYIRRNDEESQKIVAKMLGKDLSVISSTWKDFSFSIGLNQWLLTSMETEARWAMKHNFLKVKETPNYINFINTRPLENVASKEITIFR